jgi:hypothetical protein
VIYVCATTVYLHFTARQAASPSPPHADAPQPTPPKPAAAAVEHAVESGGDGQGEHDHSDASNLRGNRPANIMILKGTPANGMYTLPGPICDSSDFSQGWGSHRFSPPQRIDFPLFDGDNPRVQRLNMKPIFKCALCIQRPR